MRINLATRPFYNERLVTIVIGVVGVLALLVLAVSVQRVVALSGRRTELAGQIAQDQSTAQRFNLEAAALQRSINSQALKGLASGTVQANSLIDERTFSWTIFFGLIDKTLPDEVRIDAVAPSFDKDGVSVFMTVVSKRPEDLASFIERLQGTGAFYDVLPQKEDATSDGMRRTSVTSRYLPPKAGPR